MAYITIERMVPKRITIVRCDGCGKEADSRGIMPPAEWLEIMINGPDYDIIHGCSWACAPKAVEKRAAERG